MYTQRLVYFSNAGVPATGLTPTFSDYLDVSDGSSKTAPSITEVGLGWYKFSDNIADFDHVVAVIDGGATLADADRYKQVELKQGELPTDFQVDTGMVYDENTDSLIFITSLTLKGNKVSSGMSSMTLNVYNISNTLIMTVTDNTLENGNGIFVISEPTIANNAIYYAQAVITLNNGNTITGQTQYQTL